MNSELASLHPAPVIRLIIVDDHPVLRLGLHTLFSRHDQFTVVADADTGEAGYALYQQLKPDVMILDMHMPGEGGLPTLERTLRSDADAKVVVYTGHDDQYLLAQSLKAGALGYVNKANTAQVLIQAVREVAEGHLFISHDMMQARIKSQQTSGHSALETLSQREKEIFLLLAQGRTTKECSDMLHLSSKTVSNHATHIKFKLGVGNQVELARLAIRLGLIGS